MRHVVRNSFGRNSILAERVQVGIAVADAKPAGGTCANCGGFRARYPKTLGAHMVPVRAWLYRFHVSDDQGSRHSGPIASGKLFCSRGCAETFTGQAFDETVGGR